MKAITVTRTTDLTKLHSSLRIRVAGVEFRPVARMGATGETFAFDGFLFAHEVASVLASADMPAQLRAGKPFEMKRVARLGDPTVFLRLWLRTPIVRG